MIPKLLYITFFCFLIMNFTPSKGQESGETKEISTTELKDRLDGIDENVTGLLNDLAGLKKIKISGYMQIQFEKTESNKGFDLGGGNYSIDPYDSSEHNVQGRFRVRRSRLKTAYNAGLTQFVLECDFSNEKFTLKDAYINFMEPWTKYFSMTVGVFKRPNYEVEYSSSQRESMERSAVVRKLYPDERDLGAMLTFSPEDWFKLQIAGFNNTYNGDLKQFWPNFNSAPLYYMFRLTKELMFSNLGLSVDLGVHARIGDLVANTDKVIQSENNNTIIDSASVKKGDKIGRNWFGVEAQIYYDFLGGMKILGEYITGTNTDEAIAATSAATPIRMRNFSGFYIMLVKNISTEWQFVAKYDSYNPNTKIVKTDINSTSDLPVSTLGFGIHNYTFDNIRISLWYDMNATATNDNLVKGKPLLEKDPVDNFLILRFQYKF